MDVSIYLLRDPRNGEIRYVGLTRDVKKRLGRYVRPHTTHLENWFESIKASGSFPELEVIEVVPECESGDSERKWIKHYRDSGARLLNFTDGGERGYTISEEYRNNLKAAMKGRKSGPLSDSHKAAISRGNKGKVASPGSGKIFSILNKTRIGIPLSADHRQRVSEGVRKSMTADVRRRISESLKKTLRAAAQESK